MGCNCGKKNNSKAERVKETTRREERREQYRRTIAEEQKRTRAQRT